MTTLHPPAAPSRKTSFAVGATLVGLWLVLAGPQDPASWIIGAPAVAAATWTHRRLFDGGRRRLSVLHSLRLIPVFLLESFRGGLDVAWRVLTPQLDLAPGIRDYRLRLTTPAGRVLFSNLISLLPGTLSADLEGDSMQIHALDLRMDARAELDRLERLVAACFRETIAPRAEGPR